MTIQYGIPVARIELSRYAHRFKAVNAYSEAGRCPRNALLLLLEFHGSESSVAEQAELFGAHQPRNLADTGFEWTTSAEERNKLWQARHDAYWAGVALRPGAKGISTDVCVPISRLGGMRFCGAQEKLA